MTTTPDPELSALQAFQALTPEQQAEMLAAVAPEATTTGPVVEATVVDPAVAPSPAEAPTPAPVESSPSTDAATSSEDSSTEAVSPTSSSPSTEPVDPTPESSPEPVTSDEPSSTPAESSEPPSTEPEVTEPTTVVQQRTFHDTRELDAAKAADLPTPQGLPLSAEAHAKIAKLLNVVTALRGWADFLAREVEESARKANSTT